MPLDPHTDILTPEINSLRDRESVLAVPYANPDTTTITPRPLRQSWKWTWMTLVILTLIAGLLRFAWLDRPTAWGDEARVWWRTSGSYQMMLQRLRTAGFTPLHYTATWWITQGMPIWGTMQPTDKPVEGRVDANRVLGGDVRELVTAEDQIDDDYLDELQAKLSVRTKSAAAAVAAVRTQWKDGKIKNGEEAANIIRELLNQPVKEFTPSHPLLGKPITPTPQVIRFIPALCGTLMVPAMFWLAYQLAGRRVALMVATLTCFSAYMLVYSRDAKMYADLWLMVVLHVSCLLWWLRSRLLLAWLCMLASGIAMIGTQFVSVAILGIDFLIVATAGLSSWWGIKHLVHAPINAGVMVPVRWWAGRKEEGRKFEWLGELWRPMVGFRMPAILPFALAICVIFFAYFRYDSFNRFKENTTGLGTAQETRDGPPGGGRRWGGRRPEARADENPWTMDLGSAGINWVETYNYGRSGPGLLLYTASSWLTGWEWPREADQAEIPLRRMRLLKFASFSLIAAGVAGIIPWRRAWHLIRGRRFVVDPESPIRPWRRTLWVMVWLILPTYAWYVLSLPSSHSPDEIIATAVLKDPPNLDWHPLALNIQRFYKSAPRPAAPAIPWATNWETARQSLRLDNIAWAQVGTLLGLAAFAYMFCASDWRARNWALLRVASISLVLIIACSIVYLAAPVQRGSVWMPRYLGFVLPAFIIAFAWALLRLPSRPLRWSVIALFVVTNLSQYGMRLYASEPPTDLMARDTVLAQSEKGTRLFINTSPRYGAPGEGSFNSISHLYFIGVLEDKGSGMGDGGWGRVDGVQRTDPNGNTIAGAIKRGGIDRLIVWRDLDPTSPDHIDPIAKAIGPEWKRVSHTRFQVFDHWRWVQMYDTARSVYEFHPEPTTQPTTEPTPAQ